MCGIFFEYDPRPSSSSSDVHRNAYLRASVLSPRGPDSTSIVIDAMRHISMIFCRLGISGDESTGRQPVFVADTFIMLYNGEWFVDNSPHKSDTDHIAAVLGDFLDEYQQNDILSLTPTDPEDNAVCDLLDVLRQSAMFGIVIYSMKTQRVWYGRDVAGIVSLYVGVDVSTKRMCVSSDYKTLCASLENDTMYVEIVPPGQVMCFELESGTLTNTECNPPTLLTHSRPLQGWDITQPRVPSGREIGIIRSALEHAVETHLLSMSPAIPLAAFLSGGLDSTIIVGLMRKFRPNALIYTFVIGLPDSPDVAVAERVARYYDTVHTTLNIESPDELLQLRSDTIRAMETYDTTTIRAGIPMFALAKYIRTTFRQIKVLFSGEGSDELMAGYRYFQHAPDAVELGREITRKVEMLHLFDITRAHKTCAANGIELRVPFLSPHFIHASLIIPPETKMWQPLPETSSQKIEKVLLRLAFKDILPPEVFSRSKAQFSDAVGRGWIDTYKKVCEMECVKRGFTEQTYASFPKNTPSTPEELWNRVTFDELFPHKRGVHENTVGWIPDSTACSTGQAAQWDPDIRSKKKKPDPSGWDR